MDKFEVSYTLTAIVGVEVDADSMEKAIEKGNALIKSKGFFKPHINYINGNHKLSGVANLDHWKDIE